MLKEALQYILDGMRPETQDLCGRAYVITPSGAQEVIETPIVPATLQLHSLDSIVKMIRTEAIHLADANTALAAEVTNAEEMRKHLNEYQRMVAMQAEVQDLTDQSAELTRKIELARELPATILAEAHIPVEGLTVENGIPLINGLPISNLSDGELLELCVDISVCKPGQLEIILIDGAERLDKESRERLYAKCKAKGLQLIATRVTDSEELEVTEL